MLFQPPGTLSDANIRAANNNGRPHRELPTAPMWVPLLFTFEPQTCCICKHPIIGFEEPLYGLTGLEAYGVGAAQARPRHRGFLQQFRHQDCAGPADERDGRVLR